MAKALFSQPRFTNDDAARKYLESVRWSKGPVCPHCGGTERNSRLNGKAHRPGLLFCGDCRTQFSVTVGTVFERSKVPLHKWLLANHLLCSSKKGISAHQLHRTIGVTYKTAWFMAHRIRMGMTPNTSGGTLGGGGGIVEVDETYYGIKDSARKPGRRTKGTRRQHIQAHDKRAIVALVERDGQTRAFHVPDVTHKTLKTILNQVSREAHLMTDEATRYWTIGKEFAKHSTVNHPWAVPGFDRRKILVYKERDFEVIGDNLIHAGNHLRNFWTMRRKKVAHERDQLRRALLSEPDVQTALRRIRKGRQKRQAIQR